MASELSPESEAVIRELLASGAYADRAALVDEAVGLLGHRRRLRRVVEEGAASGPSLTEDEVFGELDAILEEAGRQKSGSGR